MNLLDVKVKKTHPKATLPVYSTPGSAGADVTATEIIETDDYIEYKIGLAFSFSEDYVMLLFPRSSVTKKPLILKNSVGVGDSDFRHEYSFRFYETDFKTSNIYKVGERIGQIVFVPKYRAEFDVVEDLDETERKGGYGSTGN